jgi:hypothetical protein
MKRRYLVSAACVAPFVGLSAWPVHAQVHDLSDAINKAGRQRALSQRMSKAWLALVHGVESSSAQLVLNKSMALFERQLIELKSFAPTPEIKGTYSQMETAWDEFKTILVGTTPARKAADSLLALDNKVLALAQLGTVQYETVLGQPLGKLVNVSGRQRMLSQRMAKFYLAAKLPVDAGNAAAQINAARSEFISAMVTLRSAPEATSRIKDELQLAEAQWVFFDVALKNLNQQATSHKPLSDVFVASENLLTVMDSVTGLYSSLKT